MVLKVLASLVISSALVSTETLRPRSPSDISSAVLGDLLYALKARFPMNQPMMVARGYNKRHENTECLPQSFH